MKCNRFPGRAAQPGNGRWWPLAVLLACFAAVRAPAQYTTDYQTNVISGVTSNWAGDYVVGSNTFANVLLIQNAGVLSNGYAYVGYHTNSSNNRVSISDTGSIWRIQPQFGGEFMVGRDGSDNGLVISNGGAMTAVNGYVGLGGASSNNLLWISDPGSVLQNTGSLSIGWSGAGNRLVVSNGAKAFSSNGRVGNLGSGSNNTVVITGVGSVWSNVSGVAVGRFGSGRNRVEIRDGGQLFSGGSSFAAAVLGDPGSDNSILVTDPGSRWWNVTEVYVGYSGAANSLVISNHAEVVNARAYVGHLAGASNNTVRVTGEGSWQNGVLRVGNSGSSNVLTVADGSVLATNLIVGVASAGCDNLVQLDSGSLIVTNAASDAVLEVRRGLFILNGGSLQADRLVMTNSCGLFVRNGGTLTVTTTDLGAGLDADGDSLPNDWEQTFGLDPLSDLGDEGGGGDPDYDGLTNAVELALGTDPGVSDFRITSIAREGDGVRIAWITIPGTTNVLETTTGTASGGFTNDFTDLLIVTNAASSATNYLHSGAASTTSTSQYYRVRLVQ